MKSYSIKDIRSNPDALLTTAQVKRLLMVSDPTLYRWRKEGKIKCYKCGGQYRYRAGDILTNN